MKRLKQKGAFLLELMIGLMMSSILIIGALTIFARFEGEKVTANQISETISNGSLGLNYIEHMGKVAGFSLTDVNFLGCNVHFNNSENNINSSFPLSPLIITTSNGSDSFSLFSGNSNNYFSSKNLISSPVNSEIQLKSTFSFTPGDIFIVGERSKECSLAQITSISNNDEKISYSTGSYTNNMGQNITTHFNDNGLYVNNYTSNAKLINLGKTPQIFNYSIENERLIEENLINGEKNIIAENIVRLKALYALDTNRDGNVDSWSNVSPTGDNIRNIIGMKIAIIIRSPLKGKKCIVTTNKNFIWFGGEIDISDIEDWQCYRFRILESTIPFRNMLWQK